MKIYLDLDGTLIDVFERYVGIFNQHGEKFGVRVSVEEYKKLRQGGYSDNEILEKKFGIFHQEKAMAEWKHSQLEQKGWLKKDTLIEKPEELIKYGYSLAIITQRRQKENALWQIERLGLDKLFEEIIVLEPLAGGNSKYQYLKGKVGKEDCIIGDSPLEQECARRLGIRGYFVKTGLFGEQAAMGERIKENYLDCIEEIEKERKYSWTRKR